MPKRFVLFKFKEQDILVSYEAEESFKTAYIEDALASLLESATLDEDIDYEEIIHVVMLSFVEVKDFEIVPLSVIKVD